MTVDERRRSVCDEENQSRLYWHKRHIGTETLALDVNESNIQLYVGYSTKSNHINKSQRHEGITWMIKTEPYNSKLPVNKNKSSDWFHCCCRRQYRVAARSDSRGFSAAAAFDVFWTTSYNWMKRKQESAALWAERWARLYKVTSIRVWLHEEEGGASCPAGERGRTRFVSAPRPSGASPHLDFLFCRTFSLVDVFARQRPDYEDVTGRVWGGGGGGGEGGCRYLASILHRSGPPVTRNDTWPQQLSARPRCDLVLENRGL